MVWVHPDYNPGLIVNDTAMLHLTTPLTFSSYVQPIAFPAANQNFSNLTCIAAGWGKTSSCVLSNIHISLFHNLLKDQLICIFYEAGSSSTYLLWIPQTELSYAQCVSKSGNSQMPITEVCHRARVL